MSKGPETKNKQWVDEDDDEDVASHRNLSGIKERVQYSENSKGQKVKTTIKYKIKQNKILVPNRVFARRNLPRFGDAKAGEENVTLLSKDFVSMEHPDDQLTEDVDDPTIKNTLASFILKQQERSLAREFDGIDEPGIGDKPSDVVDAKASSSDRYIPPSMRGAAAGASATSSEDANTLRVSNLTTDVSEGDLYELFGKFGKVLRVSLPRVEKTENGIVVKVPRGFAYVAFERRADAESALNRLDGHGYGYLIMKVEWAKPPKDGGASREGLAGGYTSGYGQKLAQDTKEKVLYASNLTGNK